LMTKSKEMAYYKIKNTTNELGKRHPAGNTVQTIEFKGIVESSSIQLQPGMEMLIQTNHLPVSAQKLRTAGYLQIIEIDAATYHSALNVSESKATELLEEAEESAKIAVKKKR
jgi:hypothetical protein